MQISKSAKETMEQEEKKTMFPHTIEGALINCTNMKVRNQKEKLEKEHLKSAI